MPAECFPKQRISDPGTMPALDGVQESPKSFETNTQSPLPPDKSPAGVSTKQCVTPELSPLLLDIHCAWDVNAKQRKTKEQLVLVSRLIVKRIGRFRQMQKTNSRLAFPSCHPYTNADTEIQHAGHGVVDIADVVYVNCSLVRLDIFIITDFFTYII